MVDWIKVEATVEEEEVEENKKRQLYRDLKGDTAYDKLIDFQKQHLKAIKLGGQAKRWWDEELMV